MKNCFLLWIRHLFLVPGSVIRKANVFFVLLCEKSYGECSIGMPWVLLNSYLQYSLLLSSVLVNTGTSPPSEVPLAGQASRYINISLASVKEKKENLEIICSRIRVGKHHIYAEFCKKIMVYFFSGRNPLKIIANSPKHHRVPFTFFHMKATSIHAESLKRRHSPSRKLFNRQNIEIE